jgi:hypothetical protein
LAGDRLPTYDGRFINASSPIMCDNFNWKSPIVGRF